MANLFSGLESLGFGNLSEMKLFESKEKEKDKAKKAAEPVEIKEADLIFDKTFTCPVCDKDERPGSSQKLQHSRADCSA